jgi:hypothetical protein
VLPQRKITRRRSPAQEFRMHRRTVRSLFATAGLLATGALATTGPAALPASATAALKQ